MEDTTINTNVSEEATGAVATEETVKTYSQEEVLGWFLFLVEYKIV